MKKVEVDFIKTKKRFPLKYWEIFRIIEAIIYGGFLIPCGIYILYGIITSNESLTSYENFLYLIMGVLSIILGLHLLLNLFRYIRFETIEFQNINKETIERILIKLKFDYSYKNNCFIASGYSSLLSWGTIIHIIIDEDKVLLNSRPADIKQAFTFFEDRKNRKAIRNELHSRLIKNQE